MDTEPVIRQVSETCSTPQKPTSSGSLFTVFKYVGIGMGILGLQKRNLWQGGECRQSCSSE